MPAFDTVVRGGTVVSPHGRARLDVYVKDGRIAHVGPQRFEADRTVNAGDLLVLPGMVDTHVHLMDPGDTKREDFPTGTASAAAHGVTTIVEHTHSHPVREVEDLRAKLHHLRGRSRVDYGLAAHVWPDGIDRIAELWRAGVIFFKVFTCTTHGVPGLSSSDLLRAFRAFAETDATCLVHCEDEAITADAERALQQAGRMDGGVVPEWRSREAELVAIQTVGLLARLTGARVTVAHVSNPVAVELVRQARSQGADVVAEACPQYFLLREHEVLSHGPFRKFTPPARARCGADEDEMWRLLRDGVLNHFSTDHAPATRRQKADGDIWNAPFGLPGLDTTLPFLVDAALSGRLAFEDVVRVYAEAPARRYGLLSRKGRLVPEADADFVLVDPTARWKLTDADVISKAGWTPYAGRQVRGAVVATFLRGEQVAETGKAFDEYRGDFVAGPGLPERGG